MKFLLLFILLFFSSVNAQVSMDNDAHCSDQEMTQMNVHNNTIDLCISSCFVHSVFLQSNINYYYSDLSPVNVSQLIISQYKSLTSEIITPPPTV